LNLIVGVKISVKSIGLFEILFGGLASKYLPFLARSDPILLNDFVKVFIYIGAVTVTVDVYLSNALVES